MSCGIGNVQVEGVDTRDARQAPVRHAPHHRGADQARRVRGPARHAVRLHDARRGRPLRRGGRAGDREGPAGLRRAALARARAQPRADWCSSSTTRRRSASASRRRSATRGYEVEAVGDGKEALARLAARRFEAVLSDISMPGMSGVELLRRVRALDFDLPVILLTGDPRLETAIEAVDAGALRYLQKPVSIAEIEGALENAPCGSAASRAGSATRSPTSASTGWWRTRTRSSGRSTRRSRACSSRRSRSCAPADGSLYGRELLLRPTTPRLPDPQRRAGGRRAARARQGRRARRAPPGGGGRGPERHLPLRERAQPGARGRGAPLGREPARRLREGRGARGDRARPHRRGRAICTGARRAPARARLPHRRRRLRRRLRGPQQLREPAPGRRQARHGALVRGVDRDPYRRRLVASVTSMCRDLGILVVAEGIETEAEKATLVELGCDLLQGFLIGAAAGLSLTTSSIALQVYPTSQTRIFRCSPARHASTNEQPPFFELFGSPLGLPSSPPWLERAFIRLSGSAY